MDNERNTLMDMVTALWQGHAIEVERLTGAINKIVNEIMVGTNEMGNKGVDFPVEYVLDAMKNVSECIASRDDFCLADCLCYEWIEIIDVYNEVMNEIG